MLLTPTYHVFEMYKVHQGATLLPVELRRAGLRVRQRQDPDAERLGLALSRGSAVHLSLVNTSPTQAVTLTVRLAGVTPKSVAGRVLTAPAMDAHNTFAAPNAVQPTAFAGAAVTGDTLEVKLPAKSVVVLALK